ncbi:MULTISPECIES: hypothetical protein [Mammaliicoccus]|uniref:Uncharacterized protein n=1 Tax=Mammaliicoccus sciuri TaxID=1296 RepID=A0ABT7HZ43_MAMSC|nr:MULTISPECIES: hypothetical protein [Mammaliicoccus]MCD8796530.1 hypothetical protein [Mammaliicoccus sciuri]MCD8837152.1 hypothetical protein [Mammaliicoccus sciuri]MCJ0912699.1 hypothetical protein [Mammaliicoccus sciuri]MCJ0914523.1 hypothetical protein [Mammaliicoccus sciuri]MCJ0920571.1 hypothetical protein [Mammaliicoccus sciuri]
MNINKHLKDTGWTEEEIHKRLDSISEDIEDIENIESNEEFKLSNENDLKIEE